MRKSYLCSLATAMTLLSVSSRAQVANYVFTQFSGTYSATTGGTVFGTTASDDQVFVDPAVPAGVASGGTGPGIPIGFTFVFNSIPFDRIGINNNGWIFFGQSTVTPGVNSNSSSGYTGISATSTAPGNLQHRVAGFARDLQGQAGGDLRVETVGATPNQTCIIQWNNYRKFAATGDAFNFQIRLCETSNIVEVIYGSYVNNATAATCEVGLRGATNADYNNRLVLTGGAWASSAAGTANNSNCAFNAALVPANGQVYRWIPPSPCAGAPAANVATSIQSLICPNGTAVLGLASSYTNTGLTYQWLSSTTSSVGPFSPITGATQATLASLNQTATTWYQVAITCTNTSNTTNSGSQGVFVAGTTTNSVPYYESFENIVLNNQLPNCSWSASNPSVICQTYLTAQSNNRIPASGSKYASFKSGTNINGDYFYSNGLQLEPGVTYSAAIRYITDGLVGWSNLSIMLGTSQSTTGLTSIASVTGAVTGQFYQVLSGTFTVPSSGLYYIAIRCIGAASAQFLTFDDLSVTIPCSLNAPALSLTASNSTICSGSSAVLTLSGANSNSWGSNTLQVSPLSNTIYSVVGTNTASGCSSMASILITVKPSPIVNVFSPGPFVCQGSSASLYAFSDNTNDNFQWNNGQSGPSIVVTPTANTSYTVLVVRNNGCTASASFNLVVKPLPQVFAQTNNSGAMCVGETVSLIGSGTGLVTFQWASNNILIFSQVAQVSPVVTTVYTLTAGNADGCKNTAIVTQLVNPCTGLQDAEADNGISVYPNPTSGTFKIATHNSGVKTIVVTDVTGRVVLTQTTAEETVDASIGELSSGIYYVTVNSGNRQNVIKLLKN